MAARHTPSERRRLGRRAAEVGVSQVAKEQGVSRRTVQRWAREATAHAAAVEQRARNARKQAETVSLRAANDQREQELKLVKADTALVEEINRRAAPLLIAEIRARMPMRAPRRVVIPDTVDELLEQLDRRKASRVDIQQLSALMREVKTAMEMPYGAERRNALQAVIDALPPRPGD